VLIEKSSHLSYHLFLCNTQSLQILEINTTHKIGSAINFLKYITINLNFQSNKLQKLTYFMFYRVPKNQVFIIIHNQYYSCQKFIDHHTQTLDSTFGKLVHWNKLRSLYLSYCHFNCSYQLLFQTSNTIQYTHNQSISYDRVNPYDLSWSGSYFKHQPQSYWISFDCHHLIIFIYMILIYQ